MSLYDLVKDMPKRDALFTWLRAFHYHVASVRRERVWSAKAGATALFMAMCRMMPFDTIENFPPKSLYHAELIDMVVNGASEYNLPITTDNRCHYRGYEFAITDNDIRQDLKVITEKTGLARAYDRICFSSDFDVMLVEQLLLQMAAGELLENVVPKTVTQVRNSFGLDDAERAEREAPGRMRDIAGALIDLNTCPDHPYIVELKHFYGPGPASLVEPEFLGPRFGLD